MFLNWIDEFFFVILVVYVLKFFGKWEEYNIVKLGFGDGFMFVKVCKIWKLFLVINEWLLIFILVIDNVV